VENIAGYVYDHTRHEPRRWRQLEADQQGTYFVSMVQSPIRAEFLRFARLHAVNHPCCDPLDGRTHSLREVTRWIGIRALAIRFISLGDFLGVLELVQPSIRRKHGSHQDRIIRLNPDDEARFRLNLDQVASSCSTSTRVRVRSGGAKNFAPIVFAFSSARTRAAAPRSSSITFRRDRSMRRDARQLMCPDSWSTGRSDRPRRR
jgi:hypothetical protein